MGKTQYLKMGPKVCSNDVRSSPFKGKVRKVDKPETQFLIPGTPNFSAKMITERFLKWMKGVGRATSLT